MKYKLLALDLDGTTLQDDHHLNPTIKSVIDKIKQHYHVIIVTGRHHTAAQPYYDDLKLETPIICCNGSYCYDYKNNHVIQKNSISKDNALQFLYFSQQYQLKIVMYTKDAMTYSLEDPIKYMQDLEKWAKGFPKALQPNIYQVNNFESQVKKTEYIWKFVVEGSKNNINQFSSLPFIKNNFAGAWSGINRIDLTAKGNSKGVALARYSQSLDIEPSEVVAAGDNFNDASMLSFAGLGIVMLQAEDGVKASADVITATDNNGNGLAALIQQYFPV